MVQLDKTQVWLALIAIIPIVISSVTAAILALRGTQQNVQMLDIAKDTKMLVNGSTGTMLESYSVLARRMANVTKMAEDFAIADAAEEKYQNHLVQQSLVHEQQEARDARSGP